MVDELYYNNRNSCLYLKHDHELIAKRLNQQILQFTMKIYIFFNFC